MDVKKLKLFVEEAIKKSKSQNEIARKCGISISALSSWLSGKYNVKGDDMSRKIAQALKFKNKQWVVCESVCSYQQVAAAFFVAKEESMWKGVSSQAGIGKTASLFDLYLKSEDDSVVFVECSQWTGRQLLLALRKATLGPSKPYESVEEMKALIVGYFFEREDKQPMLLLDEVDKLKPSAFAVLLDLYNRTESFLGAVLSGTESLENIIHNGASRRTKVLYMDEMESRLGRDFVHLWGATEQDVFTVCAANGVSDPEAQQQIWFRLPKTEKRVPMGLYGKEVDVAFTEDFRLMMQLIKEERVLAKMKNGVAC